MPRQQRAKLTRRVPKEGFPGHTGALSSALIRAALESDIFPQWI